MNCPVCTFYNENTIQCTMCDNLLNHSYLPNSVPVNSSSKEKNSICSSCTFENQGTNIINCEMCNEVLTRDINRRENELIDRKTTSESQVTLENPNFTYTDGIIELLDASYKKLNRIRRLDVLKYGLSDPCTYVSQQRTEGHTWSCGYRNIQMLCSALCRFPEYRARLFDGSGDIPSVHGIQSWIQRAWLAGFDKLVSVKIFNTE